MKLEIRFEKYEGELSSVEQLVETRRDFNVGAKDSVSRSQHIDEGFAADDQRIGIRVRDCRFESHFTGLGKNPQSRKQ